MKQQQKGARAVRQRGSARARSAQNHPASHIRQVLGLAGVHSQADQQHLLALRLRGGEVQRHRRAPRDTRQHHQRLRHTAQGGAQAVLAARAHTAAQGALAPVVSPAARLLCRAIHREGRHTHRPRRAGSAQVLAQDVQLQGGHVPQRARGDTRHDRVGALSQRDGAAIQANLPVFVQLALSGRRALLAPLQQRRRHEPRRGEHRQNTAHHLSKHIPRVQGALESGHSHARSQSTQAIQEHQSHSI